MDSGRRPQVPTLAKRARISRARRYDVTRGGVARPELAAYLLAVYRVLQSCSANLAGRIHHAGGPAKLADDTSRACFKAKALPDDAALDVQLFKEFVCEGISRAYEI